MLAELHNFITENHLIKHGDRVLLAVSGGIDSMVMADLFLHLPYEIAIAHCNFSLRGEESDLDEILVREFSKRNNIPFFSTRFDTKQYATGKKISVQMAARELRYGWFEEILSEKGYDLVATAHNRNDNVETLFINLIRGSGLRGLSAMRPVSGKTIRPLLFAARSDIEKYSRERKILFREDSSNSETKYIRNKIRHVVIPALEEINPSLLSTLSGSITRFSQLNDIVNEYLSDIRDKVEHQKDGYLIIDAEKLRNYTDNGSVLFELFRPYGITTMLLDDLSDIIAGRTGSEIITGTHRIIKNRNELLITRVPTGDPEPIVIEDMKNFPGFIKVETREMPDSREISPDHNIAYLDAEKVSFPLTIRKWHPGDYFHPLGMEHKKKLSDYFTDKKFSIPDKEKARILESGGQIVWIIGERIDNRFRITPETKKILILTYSPD